MMHCMASHDFNEGIRAVLVDKDNSPSWQPAALEQVSDEQVAACFESLGDFDLDVFLTATHHTTALAEKAAAAAATNTATAGAAGDGGAAESGGV